MRMRRALPARRKINPSFLVNGYQSWKYTIHIITKTVEIPQRNLGTLQPSFRRFLFLGSNQLPFFRSRKKTCFFSAARKFDFGFSTKQCKKSSVFFGKAASAKINKHLIL